MKRCAHHEFLVLETLDEEEDIGIIETLYWCKRCGAVKRITIIDGEIFGPKIKYYIPEN